MPLLILIGQIHISIKRDSFNDMMLSVIIGEHNEAPEFIHKMVSQVALLPYKKELIFATSSKFSTPESAMTTGQKSPNCLNEDDDPVADSYLCNASQIYHCLNEVYMRDKNGRFVKGVSWTDEEKAVLKGRTAWNKGKKGNIPWSKGRTGIFSEDTLKRMSEERRGKRVSIGTEIKKGQHLSPQTEFKAGQETWHKGKHGVFSKEALEKMSLAKKGKLPVNPISKGTHISPDTEFKKGQYAWNKGIKGVQTPWNKGRVGVYSEEYFKKVCGDKHHNWKGGVSFEPYCPKFNKQLRELIRERDDRTCQLCGTKEDGRQLSVHHVHYDKPECNPDLIALCASCHTKAGTNRDYYEGLFMDILSRRGLLLSL